MAKTLKVYWGERMGLEPRLAATETNGGTETADATELNFNHIFVNSAYSEKHLMR